MIDIKRNDQQEMETVMDGLMAQFRHIRMKYGLIVEEEIDVLYEKNNQSFIKNEEKIDTLTNRMES